MGQQAPIHWKYLNFACFFKANVLQNNKSVSFFSVLNYYNILYN